MTMRIGEAAHCLGVTPGTLRNYVTQGIVQCRYTPSGQRIFDEKEIQRLVNDPLHTTERPNDTTAYYVRASDGNQQALEHQLQELKDAYGDNDNIIVYHDKASGLNEHRKGLQRLIRDAEKGKIQHVRFTHKDRLTRFGYSYLEHIFSTAGVDIEALHDKQQTPSEELMEDFMKLIASFSGRFYQMRSVSNQRKLLRDADAHLQEREGTDG